MAKTIVNMNNSVLTSALALEQIGLKSKDALHVASAIVARCDFFLTTDKKILNKPINRIRVLNPVLFVEVYLNEK